MAGTAINAAPMAGPVMNFAPMAGMDIGDGHTLSASYINSFRISAVADRLAIHVRSTPKNDAVEFFNLCLSLARGIDYAVANSEVPSRAQDLPLLLKQVCQRRSESLLLAAIMVLMISVKNACKNGWFSAKDTEELHTLANEIGSSFCSTKDFNTEASGSLSSISTIMSRYYPRMKMGQILAFLEIKAGYGTFVVDFHITKNASFSPEDKIRLFVAQTDNIDTSACLMSPPQVNFLLNGKGVERRNNVSMDTGPQLPTTVAHMLKYGTNLLQAVGQFNGNYIVAVAFMSRISPPSHPVLPDYVRPTVAAPESDSEIIEGPSRISLNCPISFRRIKTPVKGHSCKHLQCFDFENFVDINTRRPSWRCPHCNQYLCFTDIRVDQNMVKVLKEVGGNVTDVIISADGSWKAVTKSGDHIDKSHIKTSISEQDGSMLQESILDLTQGDDEMDIDAYENEDRKPVLPMQSQSYVNTLAVNRDATNTNERSQTTASHIEDDFWSGIYLSTYDSGASSGRSDAQISGGVFEYAPTNFMPSPVLTDAISPALDRDSEALRGTTLALTSVSQGQISAPTTMQMQQYESAITNEYGRFPTIPRHISRAPIAVQALPAQTPTPQRSRTSSSIHDGPSIASQTSALPLIGDGFNTASSNMERQQQLLRSHLQQQQQLGSQNWSQAASRQHPSAYRVSTALPVELQSSHQQQPLNLRMPHISQSPGLMRPTAQSSHILLTQILQGGTQATGSSVHHAQLIAAQRVAQMARQSPSTSVPSQTPRASAYHPTIDEFRASMGEQRSNMGGSQPVTGTDAPVDLSAEQNWRPTGRMRGSLSGRAYSAALSQYIIQPTQPVQAARPLSNLTSPPSVPPSQMHVLMNNRNALAPHAVNYPVADPTNVTGSTLPPERLN